MVDGMFEGNKNCTLCRKEVEGKERFFGMSLSGGTYTFCKNCFESRKDEVQNILRD